MLAPRVEDLPWAEAEVQAIERMSGLDVTLRLGNVTHDDVLHDLLGGRYRGFWFAGHASVRGFLLTGGVLSTEEIIPMLRGRFDWVFLNTCESEEAARRIRRETGVAVVATIREIPDRLAYQTGVLFARWLADTGDVALAYDLSRPGGERMYIYEAGETVPQQTDILKILERLVRLIDGDPALRMVGLVDKLDAVVKADSDWKRATEQTLTDHEQRIDSLEGKNVLYITPLMAAAVVLAFAIALVLAFWFLTALQRAGGG